LRNRFAVTGQERDTRLLAHCASTARRIGGISPMVI
jgi:hypothetical protein